VYFVEQVSIEKIRSGFAGPSFHAKIKELKKHSNDQNLLNAFE